MERHDAAIRMTLVVGLYEKLGANPPPEMIRGTLEGTSDIATERLARGVQYLIRNWDQPRPPRAGDIRSAIKITSHIGTYAGDSRERATRMLSSGEPEPLLSSFLAGLREDENVQLAVLRELVRRDADLPHRVAFYRKRIADLEAKRLPDQKPPTAEAIKVFD